MAVKKNKNEKKIACKVVKNKMKSAAKAPYLLHVLSERTVGRDELLRRIVETGGAKSMAHARMLLETMFEVVKEELRNGHSVQTPFGLCEVAISGSFDHIDSPFDPKRNELYVKVTPPASWRRALAKLSPVIVNAPVSDLTVSSVMTASLGRKGYDTVVAEEPFVVTGRGFTDAPIVKLTDAKGMIHAVAVEAVRATSIICSFAGSAAKGKAKLEVAVMGGEDDACTFTATRGVKVI